MNAKLAQVRDHRVHHKFTDTNADPHNSKRGLFFSHMVNWIELNNNYAYNSIDPSVYYQLGLSFKIFEGLVNGT